MKGVLARCSCALLSWALAASAGGCAGEDLSISANLDRNADCEFVADENNAIARAEFDIARGGFEDSDACAHPYLAHLLVRNPNPERVVVESAEVGLMTPSRQLIQFNRTNALLPNPFRLTLAQPLGGERDGVVAVEAIPRPYADQLDAFTGGELLVRVELQGSTEGGDGVGSNALRFGVALCDGCRTFCASEPAAAELDECSARELGAEREFCIDDDC